MQIQEGKYYKDRDGNVHGPMQPTSKDSLDYAEYPWTDQDGDIFTSKGEFSTVDVNTWDLIEEVPAPTEDKQIPEPGEKEPQAAKTDKVGTGLVLIPWYSILAIGKIFIEGLRYGRDNWKKGVHDKAYQEERLEHAMLHLLKWKEGDRSEEHLAKVAWFCVTQLELERLEQNKP